MAIADIVLNTDAPQVAFLWPTEWGVATKQNTVAGGNIESSIMYFQYWPQSLQDDYQVEYAEHNIPGGSHPLYQWVGGRGRTLTFQAIFTSEINESRLGVGVPALGQSALTPSAQYTVDVDAALSQLRAWMLPSYTASGRLGETDPPPMLSLALRGTKLAGRGDVIQVLLKSAPITYVSWFPNGRPRVATVDLTFVEIVQHQGASGGASIRFIGRNNFENKNYKFRGLGDRPFLSGSV